MMLHAHLLHIPLDSKPMLVCAGDPFLPSVDPNWLPQRTLRPLKDTADALLEHRMDEQRQGKERERDRARQKEENRVNKSRKEESEEQTKQCKEWLREWVGVS